MLQWCFTTIKFKSMYNDNKMIKSGYKTSLHIIFPK